MLGGLLSDWMNRFQEELVPPDQRPVIRAVDRRRRKGRSDRYELQLLRRDGARLPIQVSGVLAATRQAAFGVTMAVFTDLSGRKQAEATLHQCAERLQALRMLDAAILAAQSPEEVAARAGARPTPGARSRAGVVVYRPATREGIVLRRRCGRQRFRSVAGFRFPLVGVEREIEASRQRGGHLRAGYGRPSAPLAGGGGPADRGRASLHRGAAAGGRGTAGLAGRRLRHPGAR